MPLVVKGYREFVRACDRAGKDSKREVRSALREVGDVVRVEAQRRFDSIDARSAAGFRTRVSVRGVSVIQSLRKTTGRHPEWGDVQMRKALLPAVRVKEREIDQQMDKATDRIADHFDQ